jgi:hypothetical protein
VRIVKQTFGAADQEHVLIEFQNESGSWVAADPTPRSPSLQVGQKAIASHEDYIDPSDPTAIGMVAGTPQAEFIGIGKLGRHLMFVDGSYEEFAHGKMWRRVGDTWIEKGSGANVGLGVIPSVTVDRFAKVQTDLDNQVVAVIAAGDTYMNAVPPEYKAAIEAYQAAGNAGAVAVGPEIDVLAPQAQTLTQAAWQANAALATVGTTQPSIDSARVAQGYAKQMATLYGQAIAAGRSGTVLTPPVALKAADSSWGVTEAAAVAVGVGAAGGLAWAYVKRKRGRR